jgi:hypothetical protein
VCKTESSRSFGRPRRILENDIKMHPQSCILKMRTGFKWLRIGWHVTLNRQPGFNFEYSMKILNDTLLYQEVFSSFNSGTQWIYPSNGKSQSSIRESVLRHQAKCCVPIIKVIQLITWHKSVCCSFISVSVFISCGWWDFVLIAAGSSYVLHGYPINKAEDTNEILQIEKHCVIASL